MKRYSLVTHLVLGMMRLGLRVYGGYLIESYLLTDRKSVVIVIDYEKSLTNPKHKYLFSKPHKLNKAGGMIKNFVGPSYVDRYYIDGKLYIEHDYSEFPVIQYCIHKAIEGKYSEIFPEIFQNMVECSALPHKAINDNGEVITDRRLAACSPDPDTRKRLRNYLEEQLGVSIPETAELMDRIPDECFADSIVEVVRKYSPDFQDDIKKYSPKGEPFEV